MNRLAECFTALRAQNKTAFIPYLMAGDPDADTSLAVMHALANHGADVLELGFPFSDPTADGIAIQHAGNRALAAGMTLKKTLELCTRFRESNQHTPIILMGYANPVMHYGYDACAKAMHSAGVDGIIIVDIPPEEEQEIVPALRAHHVDFIRLLAPTTLGERLPKILHSCTGFVYAIGIKGITGTHSANHDELRDRIATIRTHTDLPIVSGFGVHSAEQIRSYAEFCDGVVVGSALVQHLYEAHRAGQNVADAAQRWIKTILAV
ncbi:MAG: tryptophan synthase subunit alpha [Alphaproteobacteria bacterium]|nr:MAG: tryptophan synthase subunit alpha [Alphaproteobacteria bacterium]TAF13625.1 MAG: tryptophan synthase subunit alpha [Alphaproteobacteria bacterium]TAF39359.1 MAG: tryptophan synthase subunit alpha [Alphaproteobacteria bacterium]TAF75669.1 MAG: tryptophan synthase subunit alpha [Alphaproteobacteria bacterium]